MAIPDVQVRTGGSYDVLAILKAKATLTASGNGSGIRVGKGSTFQVKASVRGAVTGTDPTLAVTVQQSDNDTDYTDVVTFPNITATGEMQRAAQITAKYVRAKWVIGGTSTPTFTDTEIAVYA